MAISVAESHRQARLRQDLRYQEACLVAELYDMDKTPAEATDIVEGIKKRAGSPLDEEAFATQNGLRDQALPPSPEEAAKMMAKHKRCLQYAESHPEASYDDCVRAIDAEDAKGPQAAEQFASRKVYQPYIR